MATRSSYLVCTSNQGHKVSLIVGKIYIRKPDASAARHGLVRIIDETGEDYLFPADLFEEIELPAAIRRKLAQAV
jgi:hypothetical protein